MSDNTVLWLTWRISLVVAIATVPFMVVGEQRAVAFRAVRIVRAVGTSAITQAAPHALMVVAEHMRGFVRVESATPYGVILIVIDERLRHGVVSHQPGSLP
jgi:hypothetical protein